jgi:hypothetical protein
MYSLALYLFLALIDINLTWYAVFEKGSDYYKDLIALGIATFISVYMAVAASSGTVMLSSTTYLSDAGLMWIGIIIAVAQGFILLLEIIETIQDYYAQKVQRLIS